MVVGVLSFAVLLPYLKNVQSDLALNFDPRYFIIVLSNCCGLKGLYVKLTFFIIITRRDNGPGLLFYKKLLERLVNELVYIMYILYKDAARKRRTQLLSRWATRLS